MKLISFSVENFRSVTASGNVPLEDLTALVGRNESGKSNLLLALETVNPVGGRKDLDPVKNFPRGRHLRECKPDTLVATTLWALNPDQIRELSKVFDGHPPIEQARVVRRYSAQATTVELVGLKPPKLDPKKIASIMRRVTPVIEAVISNIPEPHLQPAKNAFQAVTDTVSRQEDGRAWGFAVAKACAALRTGIGTGGVALEEAPDELLAELEEMATNLSSFEEAHGKARELVLALQLPICI